MKTHKRYLCIVLAAMTLLLTGCGEELYELTAEEEQLIIHSAAYFVAKHNIQQKDGVTGYPLPDSFEEEESESETTTETESSDSDSDNSGTLGESTPSVNLLTMAQLIGHEDDLQITHEGSLIANSYQEGATYLVEAEAGKTFYVMQFKLTNTTEQPVTVNNAKQSPVVKLVCDAVTVRSEITFLTSDFSTYQGTIEPGESVDTILLFEVEEAVAEAIKAPELHITVDKMTKNIKL